MKTLVYKCLFTLLLLVTSGGIANAHNHRLIFDGWQ